MFQSLWEAAQRGEFKLFTSAMTLAEVYKLRHQPSTQNPSVVEDLLGDFEEPWVEIIELDRDMGITANVLCRRFAANKLYPNDSLHLASALRVPCDYLLAYDRPLNGVVLPEIKIEEPTLLTAPFHIAQAVLGDFRAPTA